MKLLLLVPLIAVIAVNGLSTEKIHNGPQDYNSSDEYLQRKETNLVDSKEDSTDDLEPLDIPGSEMLIFEDDKGHIEFELQKSIPKFKEAIHNRTVSLGDDTSLTCIVDNISGYLVSWVHSNRQMIISIHNQTITHLPHYSVSYDSKDTWTLSITSLGPDEIGDYICQVNTVPFMSQKGTVKMLDQSWCIFVPLERCIKKEVAEKCPLKCQQDINECRSNNGDCEHNCHNSDGSHSCSCREGYSLRSDNRTCQDIDECSLKHGGCEHSCHNTEGSYSCSCRDGYNLNNEMFCQDVDECSSNNGDCDHSCFNTEGSHSCSCREGFHLKNDNITCQVPVLIKPTKDTPRMKWQASVDRCTAMAGGTGRPFVPRKHCDFEIIKSLRISLGNSGYLWLPASDMAQEGVLKWWDGEDASSTPGIIWHQGKVLNENTATNDCLFYGSLYEPSGIHMWHCDKREFPMICQTLN